jgi:NAD(P)-dependent dehydrogenase (short-subunit alcohol dehydrogenase family)
MSAPDLSGEVALVTGAARGIGAETCRALAAAGARVVVTARRLAAAEAVAGPLPGALALACDVSEPRSVETAVARATGALGAPSILVSNAGVIAPIGRLADLDPEAFAAAIRTTLAGAAFAAKAVLPAMEAAGRGVIVTLSSVAARRPLEGWSAYCAAKAGLAMLTRSIDLEYGPAGIRALGFSPGVVDTGMQAEIRASGLNPVSRIPRENLAPVSEPAAAIAFLCGKGGARLAGTDVDIRDPQFREAAGLPPIPA